MQGVHARQRADHEGAPVRLGPELSYTDINGHQVSGDLDTAFTEYGKGGPWQVEQGSLHAAGGEIGTLKQGSEWTDYTMSFDTTPVANQAGWIVRASPANTLYLLILDTNDDTAGPAALCKRSSTTTAHSAL